MSGNPNKVPLGTRDPRERNRFNLWSSFAASGSNPPTQSHPSSSTSHRIDELAKFYGSATQGQAANRDPFGNDKPSTSFSAFQSVRSTEASQESTEAPELALGFNPANYLPPPTKNWDDVPDRNRFKTRLGLGTQPTSSVAPPPKKPKFEVMASSLVSKIVRHADKAASNPDYQNYQLKYAHEDGVLPHYKPLMEGRPLSSNFKDPYAKGSKAQVTAWGDTSTLGWTTQTPEFNLARMKLKKAQTLISNEDAPMTLPTAESEPKKKRKRNKKTERKTIPVLLSRAIAEPKNTKAIPVLVNRDAGSSTSTLPSTSSLGSENFSTSSVPSQPQTQPDAAKAHYLEQLSIGERAERAVLELFPEFVNPLILNRKDLDLRKRLIQRQVQIIMDDRCKESQEERDKARLLSKLSDDDLKKMLREKQKEIPRKIAKPPGETEQQFLERAGTLSERLMKGGFDATNPRFLFRDRTDLVLAKCLLKGLGASLVRKGITIDK